MQTEFTHVTKKGGVYTITNQISGLVCVGSSGSIRRRLYVHVNSLERGTHANSHLQAAWRKYGKTAFVFNVAELVEDRRLRLEKETQWIRSLGANVRDRGYNMASDATAPMLGKKHSEATRVKLREAYARHSPEEKEAIRGRLLRAAKGPKSEDMKSKLRKYNEEHPEVAARLCSPGTRAKQVASSKARRGVKLALTEEERGNRRSKILLEVELNRGAKWAHDPLTGKEKFVRDGVLAQGMEWGRAPVIREVIRCKLGGRYPGKWARNEETGQTRRVVDLPAGWEWGRSSKRESAEFNTVHPPIGQNP